MIYDFKCNNCGETFEKDMTFRQYTHRFYHKCPKCKSKRTQRVFPNIAAIFIGDGFTKSVRKEEENELDT